MDAILSAVVEKNVGAGFIPAREASGDPPLPETVAGFAFGASAEAVQSACTEAGHMWSEGDGTGGVCSGTPADVGFAAEATLRLCGEHGLCAVRLLGRPAAIKQFESLRELLSASYGRPRRHQLAIPSHCSSDDNALASCLREGTAQARCSWIWTSGHNIEVGLEVLGEEVALRLECTTPQAGER